MNDPLDKIRIAAPCGSVWDEMYGNERKRFCFECRLNVYNISNMTKTEAETFLLNSEGRVCLRVFRRKDGTVITKDCPKGLERLKKKVSRLAGSCLALIAGILGGIGFEKALGNVTFVSGPKTAGEVDEHRKANPFTITDGILENLGDIKLSIPDRKMINRF
ncbi:MAG: hypothetical protein HOP17_07880 [Acidobacteria bacterium]|nr:hypothetical protein [Acidobacteriota bacterium]